MLLCGEREYSMNNFYLVVIKSRLARPQNNIYYTKPNNTQVLRFSARS